MINSLKSTAKWDANWVWYPKAQKTVNFHFFARKVFKIDSPVGKANLRISAHTDYKLYLNGRFLGRGPTPGHPWNPSYDTYSNIKKCLKKGNNVIGIICHNYGIGIHWQPVGPGGLIVQGEIETEKGTNTIISDKTWKVKEGNCWYLNSPRMMWSCGFTETFDFRRCEENWLDEDFDDSNWGEPEILGKHPTKPWIDLIPREIPFLKENIEKPLSIEKGEFRIHGFHAVSLDGVIPEGKNCIGYAQTYFYTEKETEVILCITSDDAFKAFLNNNLVLEQNYDEKFARVAIWYAKDNYEQFHYGMGSTLGIVKNKVILKQGWNKLLIAIDQGEGGWGFSLAFMDSVSENLIDILFSNVKDMNKREWTLSGPFESTGMNDSLNNILNDTIEKPLLEAKGIKVINYNPFCYNKVTDYAGLMRSEERADIAKISVGDEFTISEEEFFIVDFGQVKTGYPYLEVKSTEGAVIDVGYNSVLLDNKKIMFQMNCIRYVDRIYITSGSQKWERFQRISGRYIHLSCRKGKNIKIKGIGINSVGYPVREIGKFASSDNLLNKIFEVSEHTLKLLMQYSFLDCMIREEGNCNGNTFNYMSRGAAYAFGDYKLAKRAFRLVIQTQDKTGWFNGLGATSPNSHSDAQPLYWIIWLKDFYFLSGDILFVKKAYEKITDYLRYLSKMINLHGLIDCKNRCWLARQGHIWFGDTAIYGNHNNSDFYEGEILGHNILYYAALNSVVFLAEELGFKDDAQFYKKRADRVKKSCNERFWDSSKNLYIDWRKGDEMASTGSQPILIAALYFDICDEDKAEKVLKYLLDLGDSKEKFENYQLGFGFYYYYFEVLFRYGKEDIALDLMRAYYGRWLELGGTTFAEHFLLSQYKNKDCLEQEYETSPLGTSAYPHFYSNILGIKPLEPGFKEVLFEPHPGDLKSAKGKVHTPQGEIDVSWQVDDDIFKMEINLPPKCRYEVKLPKRYKDSQVKVNGELLDLLKG
ncbi:family 78 glycoside hydrolase catalytic domain [bacterium]|nr:family 78 glycoside hydrolase catalytic domain [bacterium]